MEKRYVSVHALNQYIKAKFMQDISLQDVYIKGEISNFRPHPSGHLYFTLKDDSSRISAVMFSSKAKNLNFILENGMQVLIRARVVVYEVNGQYQLNVQSMQQDGIGNLYLQYQILKNKLEKEGLFAIEHKKKLPAIPQKIAVLSAKQGAAVWDVIRTIHQRAPFVKVVVFPVPVQGENAYLKIIEVLNQVDKIGFDIIILARGGGSLEELMNFNQESLARTIYELKTPIISGVGHETDFTICDFVSDLRAATPTAAALLATPDYKEMKQYNFQMKTRLYNYMNQKIDSEKRLLERLSSSYFFVNPEQLFENHMLKVNQLEDHLIHRYKIFEQNHKKRLNDFVRKLCLIEEKKLNNKKNHLMINIEKLDALSPLKVLSRGYSLVYKNEDIVKTKKDLKENDEIIIKMQDGNIGAIVKQVK